MSLFAGSPFANRLLLRIFGFIGMVVLAAAFFDDATFGFFLFLSLYFVFFAYKKSQNKKRTEEVLKTEIKETSKLKVMAHHKRLGFGYLGTTANYLFFVPDKKQEDAVIINLNYLTNTGSTMQATGDYVTVHDDWGSVTTKVRFSVFYCEGATTDGTEFGYAFVTDGIARANKMFDAVGKNSNAPQLQKVEERRKFI
ncbi:hypothetical protein COA01_23050 [Bacillus cereus]|uniref:hypothetical protein n=1 Tax=Bacillus cereus TaxID=1396 RepID=UPI000BFBF452|nr:hypothetical protein [Bacillus cereus]PGP18623.1 hypothetical protein COA01_23050 [Bacillus cereus]